MHPLRQAVRAWLSDIRHFSNLIIKRPLRRYQLEPVDAVLDSILNQKGLEFLIVFPRQAGKNEAMSQMIAYLLNLLQRAGGNIVFAAVGDGLGMAIERLEEHLDNPWNRTQWTRKVRPTRRCLGKAAVLFLSAHPQAFARGQTAHHLLVVDETQDRDGSHIEAVFTPMRAANNATAAYIGTVKLTTDYLWTKKKELERAQAADGIKRIFFVYPDQVAAENPAYALFLDRQIAKHGRQHPIVASEYFLEPIDGAGGLFPERRRRLMLGSHPRHTAPQPGHIYVATLDVAGEDEAATDPIAQLKHPARDYTIATIFDLQHPPTHSYAPGPTYRAVDVFVDHGSKHFEDHPGRPALVHRLIAWLNDWGVSHVIADESGVGQGVVSWLGAALGEHHVTGYNFAGRGQKAALGSAFLSLVETGRFKYWTGDQEQPLSDGWWFWQQVGACTYELPDTGRFDKDLRWQVPASAKVDTPDGPQFIHDDRLLSAALIAELDRLIRCGAVIAGRAESVVIDAVDPLGGDIY
jgi:hypothetical protein